MISKYFFVLTLVGCCFVANAGDLKQREFETGQWKIQVNGHATALAGNRELFSIYAYKIKFDAEDAEYGIYSWTGATKEGVKGKAVYSLESGVLKVKYESAARYMVLISIPAQELAGRKVKLDKEFVEVPEEFKTHEFKHARDYLFFPDQAFKRFALKVTACQFSNLRDFRNQKRSVFQVFVIPDKEGRAEMEFDFNVGAKVKPANTGAVQRFKAEDDLTVGASYGVNMLQNAGFAGGFASWAWGVTDIRNPADGKYGWETAENGGMNNSSCAIYKVAKGFNPEMLCSFPVFVSAGKTYTASFYAKTNKPGEGFSLFVQSAKWGEFPGSRRYRLTGNWQRYTFTFTAPNPFLRLCFGDRWWDHTSADQIEGAKIWLDDVQLQEGEEATDFTEKPVVCAATTGQRDESFEAGASSKYVDVSIVNTTEKPRPVKVNISLQDIYRRPLISKLVEKELAGGQAEKLRIDFSSLDHLGFIRVVMACESGDFKETFYGRANIYRNIPDPGKVIYAYRMDQPEIPDMKYLERYGVYGSLSFNLPSSPQILEEAKKINWTHVFTPANGGGDCPVKIFHQKMTDEDWLKFEKWLSGRIKNFGNQVYWKTLNEPNCGGYEWTPADCVKGVSLIRKQVKAVNPDAKILSPDPYNASRNGRQWLESFLAQGGDKLIDVLAIHTYRARPEDPDLDYDISELRKLRQAFKLDIPIMFTEGEGTAHHTVVEIGMSPFRGFYEWRLGLLSLDLGFSELAAASLMTRTLLTCYKNADVVTYYLSWRDDMTSGQPKASLAALNYLIATLRDADFYREYLIGEKTKTYVFKTEKSAVAVIWSYDLKIDRGESMPQKGEFLIPGEGWKLVDFMGNPYPNESKDGKVTFNVSGHPVYLSVPLAKLPDLEKSLSSGKIGDAGILAVKMRLRPTVGGKGKLELINRLNRVVVGKLKVNIDGKQLPDQDIVLQNKEQQVVDLDLPLQQGGKVNEAKVSAIFEEENGNKCNFSRNLVWFETANSSFPIKIDGDASDWQDILGQPFNSRKSVLTFPKQKKDWRGPKDLSAVMKTAYREDGLYVLVDVEDDSFKQTKPIEAAWQEDSLQIYIDLMADGGDRPGIGYDSNDQSIYVAKINGKDMLFRDYTPEWQIAFVNQGEIKTGKCSIKRQGAHTIYEFMLPKKELFPLAMQPETVFGFGIIINDADEQGNGRQCLINTPPGTQPHCMPELWPTAVLK